MNAGALFLLRIQSEILTYGMMPPIFSIGIPTSAKHLSPHTNSQKCVSMVILHLVKLTMKINHSSHKARTLMAISRISLFYIVLPVPGRLMIFFSQQPS